LTLHFLVLKLTLEVRVKFTLYECYIQYIILYLRHFLVLKLTLEVRVQFILNECYIPLSTNSCVGNGILKVT